LDGYADELRDLGRFFKTNEEVRRGIDRQAFG
jgi:hypothetical protein